MILDASVAGSRLTNLLPVHSRSWWPMVEDIFSSRVCQRLDHQLLLECVKHDEFTYLSVDGTVKCTMPLLGPDKAWWQNRQSEPFFINAADAIHHRGDSTGTFWSSCRLLAADFGEGRTPAGGVPAQLASGSS